MKIVNDVNLLHETMALTLKLVRDKPYLIISWNINGYRDVIHEWLGQYIQTYKPDVIFLSETKKPTNDLMLKFNTFTDYNYIINAHNPTHWHGVAMLIRKEHIYVHLPVKMNIASRKDSKDAESATGRVIIIHLNDQIYIVGTYTPNSGRSDQIKLEYRTKIWDQAFTHVLEILRANGHTIWIGDINVALNDIDVSNPKSMCKMAGYTPEERANFLLLLSTGEWIDVWRYQNPTKIMYTWVGSPHRANFGLRIDNVIVSKSLLANVINSFGVPNSPTVADHIPIGVYVEKINALT